LKILIVTTRVPYPPFKGDKLKIYNIVKHLSNRNEVKVLCLNRNRSELKYLDGIRSLGAEIEAIHHPIWLSIVNAMAGIFSNKPIQVLLYKSKRLASRLAEIVRNDPPDVVYFHFIRSAQYIGSVPWNKTVRVLDFTDAVSLYLSRFVKTERNPFKRFVVRMEKNRIAKYEPIARSFDTCFICSPVDRDYLLNRGIKSDFRILPNGVDVEMFKYSENSFDENRIIFTGNMPYFPNEDAAVYMAKTIFPRVLEAVPSAKLYLVGGNPARKVKKLASDNIVVTGFVENIAAEYQKSGVAVAPMRFGAGTLNKVIEPVVLGIPVIATSIAVHGLPHEVQKVVRVADDPDKFAAAIVDILKNRKTTISSNELEKIRTALSWETIVEAFERNLKEMLK